MKKIIFNVTFLLFLISNIYVGKTYVVAESGGDYVKIQNALNIAVAGDTILVREKSTPYLKSFLSNPMVMKRTDILSYRLIPMNIL